MLRKHLKETIEKALAEEKLPKQVVEISETPEESFGDYSTNVALKLSSHGVDQKPEEIAKKIIPRLQKTSGVSKVDVVSPGFINFFLEPKLIRRKSQKIIEEDKSYGSVTNNRGKKARVEYISANPTGPLHIGNARGGPLGDALANVLERSGYEVTREYYDNNIGSQVETFVENLKKLALGKEEDGQYTGSYYKELAQRFKGKVGDEESLRKKVTKTMFDEILQDAKDMGIKFDTIQHESELQESKTTNKVVEVLKSKGFVKEKDRALWFAPRESAEQAQKFIDDRDSVLVRSDGTYTYFADDIAFHQKKFESGADLIVNILGSNHHGHVPRLKAALKALGFGAKIYEVVLYQYVRVKQGKDIIKMSKRAGNYVTAREVLDEVGRDAFRFFLLSHSPNTHMDFDIELAKQQNESNPVYYVQYAHARASNILKKAESEGFGHEKFSASDITLLNQPQELTLAKKLLKLPELVEDISENLSVHQLTTYSVQVADLFHGYYEKYRVVGEEEGLMKARLNLVLATKITLRNTLGLLGISAPERM